MDEPEERAAGVRVVGLLAVLVAVLAVSWIGRVALKVRSFK